jgi:two-component system response regulator LytT
MKSKIKIGVVEDEQLTSEMIENTLTRLGYETCKTASSYEQAIQMIENELPDIVLIDIYLDGSKDGIELAEKINRDYKIPFIFLTADSQKDTLQRAKSVSPPAYLVKPFSHNELYCAIEICINNYSKKQSVESKVGNPLLQDVIFVKDGNYFNKLKINDIYHIESDHVYINIYTATKKMTVRNSLNNFYEGLDKSIFFRTHRSYVVNVNHIDSISFDHVTVNGVNVPSSRKYHNDILLKFHVV